MGGLEPHPPKKKEKKEKKKVLGELKRVIFNRGLVFGMWFIAMERNLKAKGSRIRGLDTGMVSYHGFHCHPV